MSNNMDRLNRNVYTLLVLVYLLNICDSWRPYKLKFYDPTYTVLVPEALDFNCSIHENEIVFFYFNLKQEMPNAFVHVKYVFGDYNQVYANKTINLCTFLANRKIDPLMRILFSVGERFGVLPKRCPFEKKLYYVANMKITEEKLPPVVPEGSGVLTFTVMTKIHGIFKTYIFANVSFKLENVFKKTTSQPIMDN